MPSVVTKRGDNGITDTLCGRLPKTSALISAIGELDTLNAQIGAVYESHRQQRDKIEQRRQYRRYIDYAYVGINLLSMIGFMLCITRREAILVACVIIATAGIRTLVMGLLESSPASPPRTNTGVINVYEIDEINDTIIEELNNIMKWNFNAGAIFASSLRDRGEDVGDVKGVNGVKGSGSSNDSNDNCDYDSPVFNTHTTTLEQRISDMEAQLPPLRNFILPCGSAIAAQLHIARAHTRGVEIASRRVSEDPTYYVPKSLLIYFNRLSDYFFVLARYHVYMHGYDEVIV
jgi:cob(I)alamin adenosyltransferase